MSDAIIAAIAKNIKWLDEHDKSNSTTSITNVVNKLQIQAVTLSKDVVAAYALMNTAEDDYKTAVAKYESEYEGSNAVAKQKAVVEYAGLKKAWTDAKNVYKRLDSFLDRIDKISDSQRQKISVIKQAELKNI